MNEIDEIRQILTENAEAETPVDAPVDEVVDDTVDEVIADDVITDDAVEDDTDEVVADETKYTAASLAEAIGWDTEDIYDVEIGMPDGAEPVKLGELKDKYQSAVTENAEMKSQMEGMTAKMDNFNDQTTQGQGVSQEMMQAFSHLDNLKTQYEQTDWKAIEAEDAGQAALLRQKFQEAFNQGQGAVQQAQGNLARLKQENLQRAATKMFEIIPEWNDVEVRKADQAAIRSVLMAEGYTDQDINSIGDPKAMHMLRDYARLLKAERDGKAAVKQVRAAPKVLPSGGRRGAKKVTLADGVKAGQKAGRGANAGGRRKAELEAVKQLFGKQG